MRVSQVQGEALVLQEQRGARALKEQMEYVEVQGLLEYVAARAALLVQSGAQGRLVQAWGWALQKLDREGDGLEVDGMQMSVGIGVAQELMEREHEQELLGLMAAQARQGAEGMQGVDCGIQEKAEEVEATVRVKEEPGRPQNCCHLLEGTVGASPQGHPHQMCPSRPSLPCRNSWMQRSAYWWRTEAFAYPGTACPPCERCTC